MATRANRSRRIVLDYRAIHRVADAQIAAVRDTFIAAMDAAYASLSDLEAVHAYSISPEAFRRATDWRRVAEILGAPSDTFTVYKTTTAAIFGQTYLAGAKVAENDLSAWSGLTSSLTMTNAHAIAYGEQRAGTLITAFQQEQLDVVRNVLGRALSEGIEPLRAGRMLRSTVGMNERQARALANYERGLHEKMTTGATNVPLRGAGRPLADQRFSLSNLTERRIDDMVARYRERLIAYRGEMIARTETMRAANMGAYAEQYAAGQSGLFDIQTARRIWSTTPDDRACDVCIFMDGHEVGFAEQFVYDGVAAGDPSGDVRSGDTPPIHPMCRCTAYIEVTQSSLENAFAANPTADIFAETPVDFGDWRPEGFGAPREPFTMPEPQTIPSIAETPSQIPADAPIESSSISFPRRDVEESYQIQRDLPRYSGSDSIVSVSYLPESMRIDAQNFNDPTVVRATNAWGSWLESKGAMDVGEIPSEILDALPRERIGLDAQIHVSGDLARMDPIANAISDAYSGRDLEPILYRYEGQYYTSHGVDSGTVIGARAVGSDLNAIVIDVADRPTFSAIARETRSGMETAEQFGARMRTEYTDPSKIWNDESKSLADRLDAWSKHLEAETRKFEGSLEGSAQRAEIELRMPGSDQHLDRVRFESQAAEERFRPLLDEIQKIHGVDTQDAVGPVRLRLDPKGAKGEGEFFGARGSPKTFRTGTDGSLKTIPRLKADRIGDGWNGLSPNFDPTVNVGGFGDVKNSEIPNFFHEYGHRMDYYERPAWDAQLKELSRTTQGEIRLARAYVSDGGVDLPTDVLESVRDFIRVARENDHYAESMRMIRLRDRDYLSYWDSSREIWARAYSQYMATETRAIFPQGYAAFEKIRETQSYLTWPDDVFQSQIKPAIEAVLRARGMM